MSKCQFPGCIKELPEGVNHCVLHGKHFREPKQEKKKVYAIPKVSAKKKANQPEEKVYKQQLSEFFDRMLNEAPFYCMESGEFLGSSVAINPRTICCHILEKSKFKSISMEPLNIIYLSALQHSKYDLQRERFMKEAKIAPLIRERVKLLIPLLTLEEAVKIPEYLL